MTEPIEAHAAAAYLIAAHAAAASVVHEYSTSFGISTRLLHEPVRSRVRSVYALVRVADEVVDGAALGCGQSEDAVRSILDEYERATEAAMASGFSTDLIVHGFASTARETGIGTELTRPFFASMRMDLVTTGHTDETFYRYVYGSAEVVGLMCLKIFTTDNLPTPVAPDADLTAGARALGAAFQKINFLRDLHADLDGRGRAYLPGVDPETFTDQQRDRLMDDIDDDLARARRAIDRLPSSSRAAVLAAHGLFAELSERLRATPASQIRSRRIRVSDARKALVVARALTTARALTSATRLARERRLPANRKDHA